MADRKLALMWVFSKTPLRDFWQMPGHADAKVPLRQWYRTVNDPELSWDNFADVKAMFGSASIFRECVIFNIGGNKYRLIVRIKYPHKVYVVQVLTHTEYDKGLWKTACQCNA